MPANTHWNGEGVCHLGEGGRRIAPRRRRYCHDGVATAAPVPLAMAFPGIRYWWPWLWHYLCGSATFVISPGIRRLMIIKAALNLGRNFAGKLRLFGCECPAFFALFQCGRQNETGHFLIITVNFSSYYYVFRKNFFFFFYSSRFFFCVLDVQAINFCLWPEIHIFWNKWLFPR